MKFSVEAVMNRCFTIEFDCDEPFESSNERSIFVNDTLYTVTGRNVVVISGVEPDTEYLVKAVCRDEEFEEKVTTGHETVLLNVRKFGAKGDGKTDDTSFVQAAFMSCPADGTVYIPEGIYCCGPLFLRSNISVYLAENAVLLGNTDRNRYPVLPGMTRCTNEKDEYNLGTWEGNPLDCFASMITAVNCENIDIEGEGVIDGNADHSDWWQNEKQKRIAWRPNIMFFNNCANMRVAGITIKNSPCWNIHPYYSRNLFFSGIRIENPYNSPNTDGFDPESCRNVSLTGSVISVGDDCIAIKSGKYYMASVHHEPSEHIIIRNCRLEKGHGSVTIGSEIAGGVRDVHVINCEFNDTDRGLRIKTRRGRGEKSVLTDLVFENIKMNRVHMPVTVNMFYFCDPDGHSHYVQDQTYNPADSMTPVVGKIVLKDVECTNAFASFICAYGLPEKPIEKLDIENVTVSFAEKSERKPEVPIMMDNFREMNGKGIFIKNAGTVIIRNVEVSGSDDDAPELINVEHTEIEELRYR